MGRRIALLAAAGFALLLYAWRPAQLFLPIGPNASAAVAQRSAARSVPGAWAPRSGPHFPAKMTLSDKETVDGLDGLFGRPRAGSAAKKEDPYNFDKMQEKRKKEQEMFDNLLKLKEKLEEELPSLFLTDLDNSHFAEDVVFKEPHLPPIRGRQNYQLFLRGLRDTGHLLFEEPQFVVVRATQHADEGLVKVRWKIKGDYKSPFKFFQDSTGCFDGISYYNVAEDSGLVSVHQVDYHIPIVPPALINQDANAWFNKAFAGVASVPACSSVNSATYSES
jgi:hypothetical protein